MRLLTVLLAVLFCGCAHTAENQNDVFLSGRLIELSPAGFDCGMLSVASTSRYLVTQGPADLQGKEIQVLVGCVELPRDRFNSSAGDLQEFVVGQVHHLALTDRNIPKFDYPDPAPSVDFYLKAASLKPLRPN